jgi:sugar phosphate isomerase/epimerase
MTTQDVAAQLGSSIDSRLGCSTISFRAWTLPGALADISGQGFGEIDLGALPGVCDHVPTPLPPELVDVLADQIRASGLAVRLINADVAGMNDPGLDAAEIQRRLRTLVDLAGADGTSTIMLACGRQGTEPRTELSRAIATVARTLTAAAEFVGRFGDHIAHVHIRDAGPDNINLSVGNGQVDFARGLKALADAGYAGHFTLELETRDITNDQRPAATARAAQLISGLI